MTDDLIARARAHADLHPESATLIDELLEHVPEPGLASTWTRCTDDGRWVSTTVQHECGEAMEAWHEEFWALSVAIPSPTDEQMEWLAACYHERTGTK